MHNSWGIMNKVKKAVIPVAGYGTRFLPFTKAVPKAMLPIVNVPAVQVVVEEAVASGIEQIYLIVGQHKEAVEEHFKPSLALEKHLEEQGATEFLECVRRISKLADIRFIEQKEQLGTAKAVQCAQPFIGNEPFVVMFGDDVMLTDGDTVTTQILNSYYQTGKTTLGVKNVGFENVGKYAAVEYSVQNGRLYTVSAITEKPEPNTAKSDLAPLGRYVLAEGFFELLNDVKPRPNGGEYQLTDAFAAEITARGLNAYAFEGERYDIGDVFGYLRANVDFALRDPRYSQKLKEHIKKSEL